MATSTRGFFRNAFDALISARLRDAARYVNGALLSYDDETLKALGHNREDLQKRSRSLYI